MNETARKCIKVDVTEDAMEARLYLTATSEYLGVDHTTEFTYDNVLQFIKEQGVNTGIDTALLQSICINRLYDRYHLIAQGKPAVDGNDGYYNYFFKRELDNKPKLLEDGSVDYHNVEIYEPVTQGMKVAEYVPATSGTYGYTVKGGMLTCKQGKDLAPLKGQGFTISEDNLIYTSDYNGKIEIKNNQLIISNVLDIQGDVDLTTGDIVFNGDVIIHGNVLTGSLIKISGSLTILGNVEGAYISAGGDIQLKAGMQGSGRGVIECGSDVWGKFFEQTIMRVKGNIHANSMMNCDTFCEGNIYVSGRHGIIVGGNTSCQGNIDSVVIGNMAEVRTSISAGVNEKVLSELEELENKIKELKDKLQKHSQILAKIEAIKNPTEAEKLTTMIDQVHASMHELEIQLDASDAELKQKLFIISSCSAARINVSKYLYPNVNIILNGLHYSTTDTFTNVTIKDSSGEIKVINNP